MLKLMRLALLVWSKICLRERLNVREMVRSMSGQTIEVINTDAEGRLVLADALHYTNTKFKPKFIVDLATLTGAIMVALADIYAGLFSNDDSLSKTWKNAGKNR